MVTREAPMTRRGLTGLRRVQKEIPEVEAVIVFKQTMKYVSCPQISQNNRMKCLTALAFSMTG